MVKSKIVKFAFIGGGEASSKALTAIKNHPLISIQKIACKRNELKNIINENQRFPLNDYEELLFSNSIDAVYIATPNNTHIPIALKALNCRKHVLIEKPLSHNLNNIYKIDSKNFNHLIKAVGFKKRYGAGIQELNNKIKNWNRKNIYAKFVWKRPRPVMNWKFDYDISGGGIIVDLGSHVFDLFEYIFGKIKRLKANISFSKEKSNIDETAQINFDFICGAKASIDLDWQTKVNEQYWEVTTPNRKILWKRDTGKDIIFDSLDGKNITINAKEEYFQLFTNFCTSISGRDVDLPHITDGIRNLEVIHTIYKSHGNWINI